MNQAGNKTLTTSFKQSHRASKRQKQFTLSKFTLLNSFIVSSYMENASPQISWEQEFAGLDCDRYSVQLDHRLLNKVTDCWPSVKMMALK